MNLRMNPLPAAKICLAFASLLFAASPYAQTAPPQPQPLVIDASGPTPAPGPANYTYDPADAKSPSGHTLGLNAEYLTLDGKPWLPVMGEMHYSRVPEAEWETEILKMKSAGVQIVSAYIIWIHHEEVEGQWDWSGQKDLRHFVELCAKHGMYVVPRIGPWSHAEVRNGGFPTGCSPRPARPVPTTQPTFTTSTSTISRSPPSSKALCGPRAARSSPFSLKTSTVAEARLAAGTPQAEGLRAPPASVPF